MRSYITPTLKFSSYSPLKLVICLLISTLTTCVFANASGISVECSRFCEDGRPHGIDKNFKINCDPNVSGKVTPNRCPGECKKYGCDDELCPDGTSVNCPQKLVLPRRYPNGPYGRPSRESKPFDPTILIIVAVVIGAIVLIAVAVGIYIYVSYIERRRQENLNRYQLQAPRAPPSTSTQTTPMRPPTPQPKTEKIALSTHYVASEADGVQNISTGQPQNFDYVIQPRLNDHFSKK